MISGKSNSTTVNIRSNRLILIASDNTLIHQKIKSVLNKDFEVFTADDSSSALKNTKERTKDLSLIIIDDSIPNNIDLIKKIKTENENTPIIVLTDETTFGELYSPLGVAEHITKPLSNLNTTLSRIIKTIEHFEFSNIVKSIAFDKLTGLFTLNFFFELIEQYEKLNTDSKMDAVCIDVVHFHLINDLYGIETGNMLLKKIGVQLEEYAKHNRCFACHKEADIFLLYCPHKENYNDLLDILQNNMPVFDNQKPVKFCLAINPYNDNDDSNDVRLKFDRADITLAANKDMSARPITYYNKSLHKKQLFEHRLIDELDYALENGQFHIYYQPKYYIKGNNPVLSSAEALVRWKHPVYGMISPLVFIELFEKNGLISKLDKYVWNEALKQMKSWREKFDFILPVSFNVSRIDIYDPEFIDYLKLISTKHNIEPKNCLVEITESAFTEDVEQIVEKTNALRELGFLIEMDDFGSGYSSLNMLAKIPIDALKLDMQFVKDLSSGDKNLIILNLVMQLKDSLHIPVIAEGVESAEQYYMLKDMGCDIIQGYYFSPPVSPVEFEKFLEENIVC